MLDLTKFQTIKTGIPTRGKIQITEGKLAMWSKGDKVKIPFTIDQSGEYRIVFKVRTNETKEHAYSSAYVFSVDDKPVKTTIESISEFIPKVFGDSYWGNHVAYLPLTKGTHSVEIETTAEWLGVESVDVQAVKLEPLPVEDFKARYEEERAKYLAEKTRADTLQVNLNATKSQIIEIKKNIVADIEKVWPYKTKDEATKAFNELLEAMERLKKMVEL